MGRIVSIENYNTGSGTPFDFLLYSYDANGNPTNVITGVGSFSYSYDALNQLVKETTLEGAEIDYQYDAAGNRVQKKFIPPFGSATTTTYTYNNANELTSVGSQQYTYDTN
ncbi:MAG: RHS repeat domain-containing protein [Sedimentibacter sp.]